MYFNSHARVGRDKENGLAYFVNSISTHTPAWGATCTTDELLLEKEISTHTPAWGATMICLTIL